MHFRRFLCMRVPSLRAFVGLGLIAITTMFASSGCMERKLTGLYVEPTAACLSPGSSAQITSYGVFTEGGHAAVTKEISNLTSWASDLTAVATVSSTGVVTAANEGLANIRASAQGEFGLLYDFSNVTVLSGTGCLPKAPAVRTLAIVPATHTMPAGDTLSPLAIGTIPGKLDRSDETRNVVWESSNPAVATVRDGMITAVGAGDVVITATQNFSDGTSATATENIKVSSGDVQE